MNRKPFTSLRAAPMFVVKLLLLFSFCNNTGLAAEGHKAVDPKPFVIGVSSEFESLHPLIMSSAQASYISTLTNPPLTYLNDEWKWACRLCETIPTFENGLAKIIEEKGKKRIKSEWTLRPGLKWGDGTPLTGVDFQLGFEVGRSPNVLIPERDTFNRINRIEVDPKNTLKFTIYSEDLDYRFSWLTDLSPLPNHIEGPIWEKTKAQAGGYEKATLYTTKPETPGLGYGPYLNKQVKLGSHIILVANPLWFETPPAFSPVTIRLIPNNQALDAALQSKQIDLITEVSTTPDQCIAFEDRMAKSPDLAQRFQVLYKDGITLAQLTLHAEHPILSDKRVRQAIQVGFDREKIVQSLFKGKCSVSSQFFSPLDELYDKGLPPITYQPTQAEALLDEAGWKKGPKGFRTKDGKTMSLQLLAANGSKSLEIIQQYIKAELAKIGIDLSLKNEPPRVMFGETLQKRQYNGMALFSWLSNPGDIPTTLFRSDAVPSKANSWSGQNLGAWNNPQVDELLTQASQELDTKKRAELMAKFNKLYREDATQIPLYHRPQCAIIPKNLKNFKLHGTLLSSAAEMNQWQ